MRNLKMRLPDSVSLIAKGESEQREVQIEFAGMETVFVGMETKVAVTKIAFICPKTLFVNVETVFKET